MLTGTQTVTGRQTDSMLLAAHLAGLCKALQPGDLKEANNGEHDCGQGIDGQPVLL